MKSRFLFPTTFKGKVAAILFVCCFFLFFFRQVILEGRQFSFRDGGYFYYPVLQYVHSYWRSGTIPLWDPNENVGQPLAASASAAVFYPGQAIFFLSDVLPVSYGFCYALYHLIHIALAWAAMFFLCRYWRISFGGSLVASMSYAFCGSIFGQYCNTIFLVGAAWFPLGVMWGDQLLIRRDLHSFVLLAIVLALMVLGGEPQTAYFTGLLLGGLWFVYWRTGRFAESDSGSNTRQANTSRQANVSKQVKTSGQSDNRRNGSGVMYYVQSRLALLLYSAMLAGILSMIQIVPTTEMTKLSDRVTDEIPFSIWDVPAFVVKDAIKSQTASPLGKSPYVFYDEPDLSHKSTVETILDGLLCRRLEFGGHARDMYHFNMGPWRLGELFWPNFTGKCPPNGSRWSSYLPGDYAWTYSLYIGIAPMLLALGVMTLRVRRKHLVKMGKETKKQKRRKEIPLLATSSNRALRIWGTWVVVLSLLGALGGFGPVWFGRALASLCGKDVSLTLDNFDPVGGVYWFLVVVLPKFSSFRFPGKLIPPAILGLAVLAGIGWDCGRKNRRLGLIFSVFVMISVCLWSFVFLCGNKLFDMSKLAEYSGGAIFDSYDQTKAWRVVLLGIGQSAVVALCFGVVFFSVRQRERLLNCLRFRFRSKCDQSSCPTTQSSQSGYVAIRRRTQKSSVWASIAIMFCFVLICIDLYIGNINILVTSPQRVFDTEPYYVRKIREADGKRANQGKVEQSRYFRFKWYPYVFVNPKTTADITDRIQWERETLNPKYNELYNLTSLQGAVTLVIRDFGVVSEWLEWSTGRRDMTPFIAFLDCQYLIFPVTLTNEKKQEIEVRFNEQWARLLSSSKNMSDEELKEKGLPVSATLWEITLPTSRVKILRNPELDRPDWTTFEQLNHGYVDHSLPGEYAKITRYEPNSLDIDVKLNEPGSIVLPEQYYPGWYARFAPLDRLSETVPVEITKTLDFMRRVELPAGEYRLTMEYAPPRFYFAAVITLLSWCVVIVLLLFGRRLKLKFLKSHG